MKVHHVLVLILLFASVVAQAQYTVETIPNQKLIDNSYVSNPDKILDENTVGHINSVLEDVEDSTSVQVAVVVVSSIGDADIFDFAQKLFNRWGIGSKGNDNGLLLLLVTDKHAIRFHTGLGVESTLPDATCKKIQRDYMVPEFKKGDYNAGMLQGIIQVQNALTNPAYAEELKAQDVPADDDFEAMAIFMAIIYIPIVVFLFIIKGVNRSFSTSKNPSPTPYPEMRLSRLAWLLLFAIIPVAILVILGMSPSAETAGLNLLLFYFYFMATLLTRLWREKKVINRLKSGSHYYGITEFLRRQQWYWLAMAILFPFPFFFYFFYHLVRKGRYRNHPRNCKLCAAPMRKLDEVGDDQFLSKPQLMEETLRSVDYDVWKCTACNSTEMWSYPNRFSKYKECPYCKTHAYHLASSRTVKSATYTSSGTGEETHLCKFCGKSKTSTYTIAQLTRSSSGSSFGSSSGSSFGGSSGGSWGGGRSGGGGASSSW